MQGSTTWIGPFHFWGRFEALTDGIGPRSALGYFENLDAEESFL
jgi:hypothetical protein